MKMFACFILLYMLTFTYDYSNRTVPKTKGNLCLSTLSIMEDFGGYCKHMVRFGGRNCFGLWPVMANLTKTIFE